MGRCCEGETLCLDFFEASSGSGPMLLLPIAPPERSASGGSLERRPAPRLPSSELPMAEPGPAAADLRGVAELMELVLLPRLLLAPLPLPDLAMPLPPLPPSAAVPISLLSLAIVVAGPRACSALFLVAAELFEDCSVGKTSKSTLTSGGTMTSRNPSMT